MNENNKDRELRLNHTEPEEQEASCSTQENGPRPKTIEDDANTQTSGSGSHRDPMFVIVDSSGLSEPSSRELVVLRPMLDEEAIWKKYISKNLMVKTPIDVPSTSKDHRDFAIRDTESREELQMIDINLQSENEIDIEEDNDNDSIVVSYLRNRENFKKMEAKNRAVKKPSHNVPSKNQSTSSRFSRSTISTTDKAIEPSLIEKLVHEDKELLIAAELGDDELLAKLIRKGANLNETDHLSRNALHLTVCTGNIKAVRLLLEAGLSPNMKDSLSRTPLSLCLFRKPSVEIVNLLFEHGARLVPRTCVTDTGLFLQFIMMVRPTKEEVKIIKLLLGKGAMLEDPEVPGGRQALHFAALTNNCVLIQVLVDLGADLFVKNHRNQTPKDVAIAFKCREALYCLEDIEFSCLFDSNRGSRS